jgi:uncharacterized protein
VEHRYLAAAIQELCFEPHKMALVSGPRQCGKTTLGQQLLAARGHGAYYNWDDARFRKVWVKDPSSLVASESSGVSLFVFDEIHKARGWKRTLKGMFDTRERELDLMVTGSARLNVFKRGGDSLLGRAFHLRLHPFSVGEVAGGSAPRSPERCLPDPKGRRTRHRGAQEALDTMLEVGGFPEPYLRGNARFARAWRTSRTEKVIREDLRDLSRVPELSRVEMLAALLPERVASPLSRASLREDLEVSFDSVTRWLAYLEELYYAFTVRPWTKHVVRGIKKEPKLYLWDYAEVPEVGPRFENLVAAHLLKACDYFTDAGEGRFELFSLRNKEKEEVDFLIARDGKPWLPIEAKLTDTQPTPHLPKFMRYLGCRTALQLVRTPDVWTWHERDGARILVASAADVLADWV